MARDEGPRNSRPFSSRRLTRAASSDRNPQPAQAAEQPLSSSTWIINSLSR